MSEEIPVFDDGDGDGGGPGDRPISDARRTLMTVASMFGFIAIVVVIAIVLLNSKPARSSGETHLAGPVGGESSSASATQVTLRTVDVFVTSTRHHTHAPTTAPQSTTPSASSSASTTAGQTTASTHQTTPTRGVSTTPRSTFPCPSASPCAIGGDGGAIAEVQRLRHDRVPGNVTASAQQCAVSLASGGGCGGAYASEPEFSQDGRAAADAVFAEGTSWLYDRHLPQFNVGWAYNPQSGRYFCAFVEN